ncbi:hypothetical protein [uncultured Bacteroides sp.]|uniref:hypothetical protein n=1 Tax=uncultured Bacteroides sp. TaxID=162156 RepID=UPI0032B14F0A
MAQKKYDKGQYQKCLKYIRVASKWAYSFNCFYSDMVLEKLIREVGSKNINNDSIVSPNLNKYVFLDSFGWDNRCLTQQYLRAMMDMGVQILYILLTPISSNSKEILRELYEYGKATVYIMDKHINNDIEKACVLRQKILNFSPSCLFLHIFPWDITALLTIHSIKGVIKYNINLTDHAYWLGNTFIDYNIEFRAYGKTVSLEKRNLYEEQLLALPYYPIVSKYTEFQGFPSCLLKNVKILTGGNLYKMLGKNNVFFRLMDDILDLSPHVVILVAGISDSKIFEHKRNLMKNGDRVVLIGIRKDINAVFGNCDIYLGTYPLSGGLMTQYAAINSKPIIAYADNGDVCNYIEGVINHYERGVKTYTNKNELITYARKLISDENFRVAEGIKNANSLINPERFNIAFRNLMRTNRSEWNWGKVNIDYNSFASYYIDIENSYHISGGIASIISEMRFSVLYMFPRLLPFTLIVCWRLFAKKMRRLNRF